MTGRRMATTRARDAGARCDGGGLVRGGVRAVRHRPAISPDDLSSGVYTVRRAARWAKAYGICFRYYEKTEEEGRG